MAPRRTTLYREFVSNFFYGGNIFLRGGTIVKNEYHSSSPFKKKISKHNYSTLKSLAYVFIIILVNVSAGCCG